MARTGRPAGTHSAVESTTTHVFRRSPRVFRLRHPERAGAATRSDHLLGDIQARRPLQVELAPILALTEVWFIPGNHDTDSDADHDHLFGSELADRNLHARVVEIAGFRVAGLGGVFRESIQMPSS
jgi:hypothetical protein